MRAIIVLSIALSVGAFAQRKDNSPVAAAVIEAVVPGGGFLYANEPQTALLDWGVTVALLVGRDQAIRRGEREAVWNARLIATRAVFILGSAQRVSIWKDNYSTGFRIGIPIAVPPQRHLHKGAPSWHSQP